MRFRIQSKGKGFVLTVEDGEDVVISIPAATMTEAKALQRRAVIEGVDAVQEVRPDSRPAPRKKGGSK